MTSCQDESVDAELNLSTLLGWREWVGVPEMRIPWIKAKIDTGARTSSLHAFDIEEFTEDGIPYVKFLVRPWQASVEDITEVVAKVHDRRAVRSSSGHVEDRIVILTKLKIAGRTITSEITLTNRDEMGFRMLIGRETLRQGFIVNPAKSFLGAKPPKQTRRRNSGKE